MASSSKLPPPSGARLGGDDFQHAVTWLEVLRLIHPEKDVIAVEFELGQGEAGIVDDLAAFHADGLGRFAQIKFAVDQSTPLTYEWFLSSGEKRSPLQRFFDIYQQLNSARAGETSLELLTARNPATGDPILQCISNNDGRLVPRLFASSASRASVEAREAWAEHLGISDDDLRDFLTHLVLSLSRGTINQLFEHGRDRMEAVGLRGDENAIMVGVSIIRELIRTGQTRLERDELNEIVASHDLLRGDPRGTLLIQEIDHRPWPDLATASLNWVDRFEGAEPRTRRRPIQDDDWNTVFRPDLVEAAKDLRRQGETVVRVEGAFRLATAFAAGVELSAVSGFHVALDGRDGEWSSQDPEEPFALAVKRTEIEAGEDLAIALGITHDPTEDVVAHLTGAAVPAKTLLTLSPEDGPGPTAIQRPGQVLTVARYVVEQIKQERASTVHIFLACPKEIALALGHIWNRMPKAILYADLGTGQGYIPTYSIAGN
jgi:hypothetical protein